MLHLHLLVNDCFLAAAAGLHALWLNSAFVQCDLASCPPTGRLTSHTWPFLCWAHELSSSRCWTYCHNWRTVSACLRSVGLLTQSFGFYVCFMRGSSPCWQILFLPSASFSWLHLSISDTLLLMITSWFLSPICSQVSRPFWMLNNIQDFCLCEILLVALLILILPVGIFHLAVCNQVLPKLCSFWMLLLCVEELKDESLICTSENLSMHTYM